MRVEFDGDVIVRSRRAESDGVLSLEFGLASGEPLPAWAPGAHIDVVLPNGLVRQYSLCGPVDDRTTWRIGVLREPRSRGGSEWIHDHAHEGAELRIRGPRNNFPLHSVPRYVFIAGGIGISPLLPMIAEADAEGADWALYYSGRSRGSMAFLDELKAYGDRVTVQPSDEPGTLDLAAILGEPTPSTLVYCCGSVGLIEAVESGCAAWPSGSLHVERFADAVPAAATGADQPIEVECRRSGITLTVPADVSILKAVEDAGLWVLSSCQEGICGSCETEVLEGEVDNRDSLLTAEERAANDTMMICVSRVKGSRLVLDL
ncbi:oxidoreductase [Streptomyces sp. 205]|uniref:Oxidoreductase n=2 Tax=Streptomyces coffeae TaxID=621382 RepID=A0ABS1NE66_9ACTN|nr:PDR/VanB family oxidoreductase [Streptomyces coffeae]MBL1098387.1 oxidoreductase [Streptomyces coffeae]